MPPPKLRLRRGPRRQRLVLPSNVHWHHGGMHVSPLGHLAVACAYQPEIKTRDGTQNLQVSHALGQAWLDEAEWMYGGVGKNRGNGCGCWNARFAFDYFARSFVPEMDRYSVAILDRGGNTILRFGRYGNVDSAGAQSRVPLDGDGDGMGLVHGALATHTDHRHFVADPANARIVSVRLGYRETRRLALGPHAHSTGRPSNLGPRR